MCFTTVLLVVAVSLSFGQGIREYTLAAPSRQDEGEGRALDYSPLHSGMIQEGGNPLRFLNMNMSHSVSYTYSNQGGVSRNYATYTNTMCFQPYSCLDARVDIGVSLLRTPTTFSSLSTPSSKTVFLRNLEVNYRPTDSFLIQFQISQEPYRHGYFGYFPFDGPARETMPHAGDAGER
jgi:hypothetical protein